MLIRLSAPRGQVATIEQIRAAVRATGMTDDDALLEGLLGGETQRYEDFTGRTMLPVTMEARFPVSARTLRLPVTPIRAITEIVCVDANGAEQLVSQAGATILDGFEDWTVILPGEITLPDTGPQILPLRVRFEAGYASSDEDGESGVPTNARQEVVDRVNILMMMQWRYDRDEALPDERMRAFMGNRRIFR